LSTPERPNEPARVIELASPASSNQEIIAGILRGDPGAADALYERFADLVNNMVWKLRGSDVDHEDLVHQVFVNVITSIGKIVSPAALSAWVMRITINTVRKDFRSKKVRRILHLEPEVPEVSSDLFGPEKQLIARSFYAIVNRMGATQKIFFILRFVEGYTIGEIAAMSGCSPRTVRRKIDRARDLFVQEAWKDRFLASVIEEFTHEP
jgi:RNA polymerase sigma-70 factor (ECF subfamily)